MAEPRRLGWPVGQYEVGGELRHIRDPLPYLERIGVVGAGAPARRWRGVMTAGDEPPIPGPYPAGPGTAVPAPPSQPLPPLPMASPEPEDERTKGLLAFFLAQMARRGGM
jgi:hypothetical protein